LIAHKFNYPFYYTIPIFIISLYAFFIQDDQPFSKEKKKGPHLGASDNPIKRITFER